MSDRRSTADEQPRMDAAGEQALERLRDLPGGPQLLALCERREDVELIGGAVRDLLLGGIPREIDVVLDGAPGSFPHSAVLFARDLAELIETDEGLEAEERCEVAFHERFGTAALRWHNGRVDVAARRAESYAAPGALPQVRPGTPEEDLRRRDFTVNAIAIALGGARRGRLRSIGGALEDLRAGRLRVLHDDSFLDDPTRLLRLARYAARLGFEIEPHTAELAAKAAAGGSLGAVSGTRVGAELRLAAREGDPVAAFGQMARIGVLAALDPRLELERETLLDALALLPADGRPDLLALASLMLPISRERPLPSGQDAEIAELMGLSDPRDELLELLEWWEYPAADRRPVIEAAMYASFLATEMPLADSPSQLWELLNGTATEAVALAGALGVAREDPVAREVAHTWLARIRHVRLQITGDDLLEAGLEPGPEIGARLEEVLYLRLDGLIEDGREAELRAALEI